MVLLLLLKLFCHTEKYRIRTMVWKYSFLDFLIMMRQNSSNNLLIFVTNSPINSNFLHAPPPCKSLLPSWHFLLSLVRLNAFVCHLDVENMDHPRPVSPHNLFKQACDCARLHIRKGGGGSSTELYFAGDAPSDAQLKYFKRKREKK